MCGGEGKWSDGVGKVCDGEGKLSDDVGKVGVMVKANRVKGG